MENKKETIEWEMILPDGSKRLLHMGKNEVKSEEINSSISNNSVILFEIYFSPAFKSYLRFYGYTPLRLHFEKIGEFSKHILINNNQSFVYLDQLEYTTIDVYDGGQFVTFSFQKNIKKEEKNNELSEKEKRIQWLNDNIEYEDLKKEENEFGTISLYSQNYFNYNKKRIKNRNDKDKIESMSELSKEKSENLSSIKEKKNDDSKRSEKSQKSEISENSENSDKSIKSQKSKRSESSDKSEEFKKTEKNEENEEDEKNEFKEKKKRK